MNPVIAETIYATTLSLLMATLFMPVLMKLSLRIGWVDKPNHRKLHAKPIPVIGGILVFISFMLALTMTSSIKPILGQYGVLIAAISVIFVTGVLDDRMDISAKWRLVVQLACAYGVAASGIRLSSLHGVFGIGELPIIWQYVLTIMIIAGVTNAFNLMDGIDGLAGGLALINMLILAILSYLVGKFEFTVLLMSICGALVIFLLNNIHPAKIFMGDGGSLMLGFLMASTGIVLIESGEGTGFISNEMILLQVTILLIVPVFDSLRVYIGRIRRGGSPFRADKSHLHHLFLTLGLNHKRTSYSIYALEIIFIVLGFLLNQVIPFSLCLVIIVSVFLMVTQLLEINSGVDKWRTMIEKIEKS